MELLRVLREAGIEPDPNLLMVWLQDHVDDAALHEVASADAIYELDDTLEALRRILSNGAVLEPIEVRKSWIEEAISLQTFHWHHSEGENADGVGATTNLASLFATTVIVMGSLPGSPLARLATPLETAIPTTALVAKNLGADAVTACRSMLAHAAEQFEAGGDRSEAVLSAMAAALTLDPLPRGILSALLDWDLDAETTPPSKERWHPVEGPPCGPWAAFLTAARWPPETLDLDLAIWGQVQAAVAELGH